MSNLDGFSSIDRDRAHALVNERPHESVMCYNEELGVLQNVFRYDPTGEFEMIHSEMVKHKCLNPVPKGEVFNSVREFTINGKCLIEYAKSEHQPYRWRAPGVNSSSADGTDGTTDQELADANSVIDAISVNDESGYFRYHVRMSTVLSAIYGNTLALNKDILIPFGRVINEKVRAQFTKQSEEKVYGTNSQGETFLGIWYDPECLPIIWKTCAEEFFNPKRLALLSKWKCPCRPENSAVAVTASHTPNGGDTKDNAASATTAALISSGVDTKDEASTIATAAANSTYYDAGENGISLATVTDETIRMYSALMRSLRIVTGHIKNAQNTPSIRCMDKAVKNLHAEAVRFFTTTQRAIKLSMSTNE